MKREAIEIDGVKYAPVIEQDKKDDTVFTLVRTYSAGVHAGYLELADKNGKECTLREAVRIWYWDGAASLSQLAMEGVTKPENCKFAMPVDEITLTEAIEYIPCRKVAADQIKELATWKK